MSFIQTLKELQIIDNENAFKDVDLKFSAFKSDLKTQAKRKKFKEKFKNEKMAEVALVLKELVDTEGSYTKSMEVLNESMLMKILKALPKEGNPSPEELETLLKKLMAIRKAQSSFSLSLQGSDTKQWLDKLNLLKLLYSEYSDLYQRLANALPNIPDEVNLIINKKTGGDVGRLDSLLIMPVQRGPRYALLMQQLIKHLPEDHPKYQDFKTLMEGTKKFVEEVNASSIKDKLSVAPKAPALAATLSEPLLRPKPEIPAPPAHARSEPILTVPINKAPPRPARPYSFLDSVVKSAMEELAQDPKYDERQLKVAKGIFSTLITAKFPKFMFDKNYEEFEKMVNEKIINPATDQTRIVQTLAEKILEKMKLHGPQPNKP